MNARINHVSMVVHDPERAAVVVANLSQGVARPFKSPVMQGAWECVWDASRSHLIQFLPTGWVLAPDTHGANYVQRSIHHGYNSTHVELEIATPLAVVQQVAESSGCKHRFRPTHGGPLYEVWVEAECLIELVSEEIRALRADEKPA